MFNGKKQKLPHFPILVIIVIIIVIYILMYFHPHYFTAYDKKLINDFINIFWLFIGCYFIVDILNRKLVSSSKVTNKIPQNFKRHISKDKTFSFYYPKNWQLTRAKDPLLYIQAKEPHIEKTDFLKNFNISFQNITAAVDLELLFKMVKEGVLSGLTDAKLEYETIFHTRNLYGIIYKINYKNNNGLKLCCYQIPMTNNSKTKMVILTFTAKAKDFPQAKSLFDTIANLMEISN
ncbi:MAG: hypothetical protein ABIG64_02915 [Candidatus Omnitrophota bacterium]